MVKKWFKVEKRGLSRFGYSPKISVEQRRKAIDRAVKAGARAIFRRLQAIANVTKKSQPANSKIYLADANYVRKKYYKTKHWK